VSPSYSVEVLIPAAFIMCYIRLCFNASIPTARRQGVVSKLQWSDSSNRYEGNSECGDLEKKPWIYWKCNTICAIL